LIETTHKLDPIRRFRKPLGLIFEIRGSFFSTRNEFSIEEVAILFCRAYASAKIEVNYVLPKVRFRKSR